MMRSPSTLEAVLAFMLLPLALWLRTPLWLKTKKAAAPEGTAD